MRLAATRALWPSWFLIAWLVPSWAVFELTATKLPHYTLPLYPALAILAARAAASGAAKRRRFGRRFAAILYAGVGVAIAGLIAALPHIFGAGALTLLCYTAAALIAAGSLLIAALFIRGEAYVGALAAAAMGALVAWTVLAGVLPSLDRLMVSPRLSAALDAAGYHELRDGAPPAALAGYSEPSAVFLLGARTLLTNAEGAARHLAETPGSAAVIEARLQPEFDAARSALGLDTEVLAVVDGFNYSKGRNIRLSVIAARTHH
jgi:4-amino-4-deoxy-L-arabinose transferase-like glycosyltransferase